MAKGKSSVPKKGKRKSAVFPFPKRKKKKKKTDKPNNPQSMPTKRKAKTPYVRTSPETVKINKSIATFAARKQLEEAVHAFNRAKERGLANTHTYAATINAYVRCGNTDEAEKLLQSMETIDIVSYTTVIKGLCNDGRLHDGLDLVGKMTANNVLPNVRTANTLLRGCILLGQVSQAVNVLYNMEKKWGVSPDASSWEYVVALLCRGMQIDAANTMVGRLKQKSGNDNAVCNNPALYLCICRCNAILGRWKAAAKAGNKALEFLREEEERDEAATAAESFDKINKSENPKLRRTAGGKRGWGSQATSHSRNESLKLFKLHRRQEMREEIKSMISYVQMHKERRSTVEYQVQNLSDFLKRVCLIPPEKFKLSSAYSKQGTDGESNLTLPDILCRGLSESFGLSYLSSKYQNIINANSFRQHFQDAFAGKSEAVDFKKLMGHANEGKRPIKIEICSGAGEWVVSQAKNDPAADWVSMEIRYDRVYQIFCRAIFENCKNLSIVGGDASKLLPKHIPTNCAKYIFVNYPEPPQQKGEDYDSQSSHLLTEEFIKVMLNVLTLDGTLTILTDNEWYAKMLLKTVDKLTGVLKSRVFRGPKYKVSEISKKNRISLYEGLPGPECGVANVSASSYFDRLWRGHQQQRRFFLALSKK